MAVGWPALFGSACYYAPHERCEAMAREQVGDERYAECVRQGSLLGRDEAVARALGRVRTPPLGAMPAPAGRCGK